MTFQAAKCPECGADIQVPRDRDAIKCMYCGKDIVVREAVRAAGGPNLGNLLKLAEAAEDAGNHDEAYDYFTRVLEHEPESHVAWFGKGVAAGWGATLVSNRYPEMLSGIERAISFAPADAKEDYAKRGAVALSDVTVAFFKVSVDHTREFISLDTTWSEHVERCVPMITALDAAVALDPTNRQVIENGIFIAKSMIEGVEYEDEFDHDEHDRKVTKTKHLSDDLEERVKAQMATFVAKMQALDPTYKAPRIWKAGNTRMILGSIAFVIAAGVAWWAWSWVSTNLKHAVAQTPVSPPTTDSPAAAVSTSVTAPVQTVDGPDADTAHCKRLVNLVVAGTPAGAVDIQGSMTDCVKLRRALRSKDPARAACDEKCVTNATTIKGASSCMASCAPASAPGASAGGSKAAPGPYKAVRLPCPEGTEPMGARFACQCHANDGTNFTINSPKGRDCQDMAGAEGNNCVFMCR